MRRGDVDIKRPELQLEGTSCNGRYPDALFLSFVKMKLMQVSMMNVEFVRQVVYSHFFSVFLLIIFGDCALLLEASRLFPTILGIIILRLTHQDVKFRS